MTWEPATLAFLFGNQVAAAADSAWSGRFLLPCSGASVQIKSLANNVLAIALWELREWGLVSLGQGQRRGRFGRKTPQATAQPVRSLTPPDTVAGGLFTVVQRAGGEVGVREVVAAWVGRDFTDPWMAVNVAVQRDAAREGFLREVQAGLATTRFEPDCDRVQAAGGAAADLIHRWKAFQTSEPELGRLLVEGVHKGIASRLQPPQINIP